MNPVSSPDYERARLSQHKLLYFLVMVRPKDEVGGTGELLCQTRGFVEYVIKN